MSKIYEDNVESEVKVEERTTLESAENCLSFGLPSAICPSIRLEDCGKLNCQK